MKASELHSKRLMYRPLDCSFASEEYVGWLSDPEVIRYMETGGNYSIEKLTMFLKSVEEKEMLFWAILLKSGKHIGNIKIDPVHWKYRNGEYGIMMGDRNEWGKGYAREASETIIDHCFSESVNLRKITLGVVEDNFAALKLYEKLGFEVEGIYKKHVFHQGKWCNVVRMAIFNRNFKWDF